MKFKRHVKAGIRLIIESDGNLYTLVIRSSKAQLLKALDYLLPDDTEPTETLATKYDLRDEKKSRR
jgi:hypothetical protein